MNDATFRYLYSTPIPQAWLIPQQAYKLKLKAAERVPAHTLWSRTVRVSPHNDVMYRLRLQRIVNDYWRKDVIRVY